MEILVRGWENIGDYCGRVVIVDGSSAGRGGALVSLFGLHGLEVRGGDNGADIVREIIVIGEGSSGVGVGEGTVIVGIGREREGVGVVGGVGLRHGEGGRVITS